jgi:hypothetical protein
VLRFQVETAFSLLKTVNIQSTNIALKKHPEQNQADKRYKLRPIEYSQQSQFIFPLVLIYRIAMRKKVPPAWKVVFPG